MFTYTEKCKKRHTKKKKLKFQLQHGEKTDNP